MKKSSLPSKPKEPTPPTKAYRESYTASVCATGTLADLIKQIEKQSTQSYPGARACEQSRVVLGPVTHDKVTFHQDYDEMAQATWQQTIEVTLTDAEFERRQAKHVLAMNIYRAKLAEYEENMKQYEIDLRAYLDHQRQTNEERERALLATLQSKYSNP